MDLVQLKTVSRVVEENYSIKSLLLNNLVLKPLTFLVNFILSLI